MNRYVIVLILFLISCTSISNYIAVATSKRGAKKSQKWAKESVEVMEQMQQLIEEMQKSLLNELDTTIHHSDNLTKKIKENSDKFVNKLYDEINNGLLSFINPESFIVEVKLSVEHTKWYDSTFISMEYELDEDENITFKVNNKGNFDFGATKDELIKSFNQEGLIQNEWYFLDENLILFIAVKPEINIHIDKTLEINMYKTPLSLLINEILNCTNTGSCVQSIRFDEFEGRINFISTDMSKIMKQEVKPKTMVLSKEDVYDESWAVIIGIDKYQYSDQLNYAVKDAKAVKNMLINKFNYPEENIRYLVDEEATLSNIKLNLGEVATSAEENDRILIFYSGHGETLIGADNSEKGYIIPFEGKQDNPYATGIAMDEILTTSQMSKSRHMLFLMDACYSGLMTEHVKGLSKPKGDGYLSKVANEKARQIITAGGNEPAIEGGRWNHSVFTKNLLEGLDDWAADTDSDGYITADELGTYLRKSVTEDSNNQQTPQKGRFINSGGGEFVFFSDATVTIPSSDIDEEDEIIYGCMDEGANNYNPNATNPDRSCQYGKVVTTIEFDKFEWINNTSYGEVALLIDNNDDIGGYQLEIVGGDILKAWGGISEENGFLISTKSDAMLAFTYPETKTLPKGGNQILIYLQVQPKEVDVCIKNIHLSDINGEALYFASKYHSNCFKP